MFAPSMIDKPARGFRVNTKPPAPPAEYKREKKMINTQKIQGNGFNHNRGLSNNAISAQAQGLIPGSVLLKKELLKRGFKGIPQQFLTQNAPSCEYHHHGMPIAGSKYVKTVNYYDMDQVIEWLAQDDTMSAIETFKKSDKRIFGSAFSGIVEFKEYRCEGAYNSKSLHLVRVLATVRDSGSQWTIEVLSNNCTQRMVWCKSRYGRRDSDYTRCSSYSAGDLIVKSKDNVEFIQDISAEKISDMLKSEKKSAALAKRRATIAAKKEAKAKAEEAAIVEANRQAAFRILDEMKQQFIDSGADWHNYSSGQAAWYIYSKFFEGLISKPEYITCGMIKHWIKSMN